MDEDEEYPNSISLPLDEFLHIIEIVEKSRELLDCIEWRETPNERLMFIRSSIPGGPKVLRDRLNKVLNLLDKYIQDNSD